MARKNKKPASALSAPESHPDCTSAWKEQLTRTCNDLVMAIATADCKEKQYGNATAWEQKLSTFYDNIQQTDTLYLEIDKERDLFQDQAEKVSANTRKTVETIQILLCDIQDVLDCSFDLKMMISLLKAEIKGLKNQAENQEITAENSKMIECLENTESKRTHADEASVTSLLKAGDSLRKSEVISASINTPGGLLYHLDHVDQLFTSGSFTVPFEDGPPSCKAEVNSKPIFPLASLNEYYKNTLTQRDMSREELTTAKTEYYDARKRKEALNSAKISLTNAIAAAENAKDCK